MSDGAGDGRLYVTDPLYVGARRVLLDALTALGRQVEAVIVVGAQAIYLRTAAFDATVAVAPFTTDADLAVNPARLVADPRLEEAMTSAGFVLKQISGHVEPGIWLAQTEVDGKQVPVPVDLMVPAAVATGGGRRGARLGLHGQRAARRATGLEAALVDRSPLLITALESGDDRRIRTNVAGVLCSDSVAGGVSVAALGHLDALFGRRGRTGIQMAARALRLGIPEERVAALSVAYTRSVLDVVATRPG